MKNRHLMGALIAIAPVVAMAQVATTPPVGNASESATMNSVTAGPPIETAPVERDTDATTDSLETGTNDPQTTTATPPATTTTPDPIQPKPKP
ncbi:hypothetical protein [Sphingomonas montana]|uniref:hypothetical protein n=1 Tax=Sphingomonas montana TaxID=1843236 RepID=UPI00096F7F76|nr:hypothetical protein [Sphingomonas montana]